MCDLTFQWELVYKWKQDLTFKRECGMCDLTWKHDLTFQWKFVYKWKEDLTFSCFKINLPFISPTSLSHFQTLQKPFYKTQFKSKYLKSEVRGLAFG